MEYQTAATQWLNAAATLVVAFAFLQHRFVGLQWPLVRLHPRLAGLQSRPLS